MLLLVLLCCCSCCCCCCCSSSAATTTRSRLASTVFSFCSLPRKFFVVASKKLARKSFLRRICFGGKATNANILVWMVSAESVGVSLQASRSTPTPPPGTPAAGFTSRSSCRGLVRHRPCLAFPPPLRLRHCLVPCGVFSGQGDSAARPFAPLEPDLRPDLQVRHLPAGRRAPVRRRRRPAARVARRLDPRRPPGRLRS